MQIDQMEGEITRLRLSGRMDYAGATGIDAKFMEVAAGAKAVLVDMSKVEFLASMGIRTLIMAAKLMKARGDRLVMFNPEMMVAKVLQTSGTDILIPVYYDLALAGRALQAARAAKS